MKIVDKFIKWSNGLPGPIEIYKSKIEEFSQEIKE